MDPATDPRTVQIQPEDVVRILQTMYPAQYDAVIREVAIQMYQQQVVEMAATIDALKNGEASG